MKQALLLVSFGSVNPQSISSLLSFEKQMQLKYPEHSIRWAYTSGIVRQRLTLQKEKTDSVLKALQKLQLERFTHVLIQSLHLIPGQEYSQLQKEIASFQSQSSMQIALKAPLLESKQNIELLAKTLLQILPQERQANDLVLFMAHGTSTVAEQSYIQLNQLVQSLDPQVFIGTMKGELNLEYYLQIFAEKPEEKLYLLPLLVTLGKHSIEDMAGSKPDSWLSQLVKVKKDTVVVLKGLVQYPELVSLWLNCE